MSLYHPKDVLTHAISTFSEATKGLAELEVSISGYITTKVTLRSQYVSGYSLVCLEFSTPKTLYPVSLKAGDINTKVLGKYNASIECSDKAELCDGLNQIFLSEAFTEVVQNLISVASATKSNS
ncbi:hypothetical protein ABKY54_004991 [Vibrio harveyi]|uniref:hypothetical protein n=1 Tax=Vibrio harveyi TaxID=669 RepID=UPI001EFDFD93|nr:hypothetical protein [Vibrio harveyi]MCG9612234.1 hypothetical protein [Vibrio harveyi]MCG9670512.1 hypothetical protein [Vibrio harveyi]